MTANTSPIFPLTPVIGLAAISTANTNRDGTGTIGTVLTGSTDGTRVHRITIKATVTTTAGMVRLYIYDGSAYKLWREVPISAITASASVAAFEETIELFGELGLILPNNYSLRASTEKAENFNVIAEGANF